MRVEANLPTRQLTAPKQNVCVRTATRMQSLVAIGALALGASVARADAITDWNVIAFDTFKAANVGGNPLSRALAIMNVAMSDAINTVQNRYTRYTLAIPLN